MSRKLLSALFFIGLIFGLCAPALAATGDTVDSIKKRGRLLCTGHNGSYLGFAEVNDKGQWTGHNLRWIRGATRCLAWTTLRLGFYLGV